jgi:predicted DNA binding CopG/RHH family protein
MKKEYDFTNSTKNPYAKALKKQITVRLDETTIEYFKKLAQSSGIPYQTLINLYLRDCAQKQKRLNVKWASGG